jgi:flagellar biosynthesis anti-sigma factor FlgM
MEIRNSAEALKTLLGVNSTEQVRAEHVRGEGLEGRRPLAEDRATLSSAGTEISQGAAEGDMRLEKVAAVRAAVTSGTYNVPASAVASKVVDAMLQVHESPEE